MFVRKASVVRGTEEKEKAEGRIAFLEGKNTMLTETVKQRDCTICEMDMEKSYAKRDMNLEIKEKLNALRSEMQQSLIESDIKRVKAEAHLETYKEMDTKTERIHQREMLKKAIEGLSQKPMLLKGS